MAEHRLCDCEFIRGIRTWLGLKVYVPGPKILRYNTYLEREAVDNVGRARSSRKHL